MDFQVLKWKHAILIEYLGKSLEDHTWCFRWLNVALSPWIFLRYSRPGKGNKKPFFSVHYWFLSINMKSITANSISLSSPLRSCNESVVYMCKFSHLWNKLPFFMNEKKFNRNVLEATHSCLKNLVDFVYIGAESILIPVNHLQERKCNCFHTGEKSIDWFGFLIFNRIST